MRRIGFVGLVVFAMLLLALQGVLAQSGWPGCSWGAAYDPTKNGDVVKFSDAPAPAESGASQVAGLAAPAPTALQEQEWFACGEGYYYYVVGPGDQGDCFPESVWTASATPVADGLAKRELPSESVVDTTVDLTSVKDPAQRKIEEEFLRTAIAKEQAYYAGNADAYLSFYADSIISVQPETEELDGKAALAEGLKPFMENNRVVGHLTIKRIWVYGDYATRQAEWEEWVTPKDGSPGEHHIGRCTLNWEKINGEWKVTSEYINFLVPPTPIE